jgi:cytochrome b involved in lipid metabolism
MSSPHLKVSLNETTMINDLNDDDNEMDDIRHMNDSTLPKARTTTISSSLSSKKTTLQNPSTVMTSISTTSRISRDRKVLRPGFGLGDWTRLLQSSRNLAQRNQEEPLRRDITREEVAQHCYEYDAWIILYGKVYNISPYLPYHPGGIKILKSSLGKDATALFEKYHRWVNVEGYVKK